MEPRFNTCPLCNGSGLKITSQEFYMEECECVQIERIRNHVKDLKARFLTDTPLLPYLNKNTSLVIQTDNFQSVRCHIKTALVMSGGTKSYKIVNPGQLVALSIENPSLIENVDLLVIESPIFPHYENASKRHEFTMATREALLKPTWFVIPSTLDAFKLAGGSVMVSGFKAILSKYKFIKLSLSETNQLLRTPNIKTVVETNKGCGLAGVNTKLLDFHPEINQRLHEVKE